MAPDPCSAVTQWDGRSSVVCHVAVIDEATARVLSARPDRENIDLLFKRTDAVALSSSSQVPWARSVIVYPEQRQDTPVDLKNLAALTGLRRLQVRNALVRRVEVAWDFHELRRLHAHAAVAVAVDLSGARACAELRELSLGGAVVDLRPLASLVKLESLSLPGDQSDLSALSGLSRVSHLTLRVKSTTDLAPLAGLTGLHELVISGAPLPKLVQAVAPLPRLTRRLLQDDMKVRDVRPLRGLERLELIELGGTRVTDVAPLQALPALKTLRLWNTPVKNVRALLAFPALEQVSLPEGTPAADLAELRQQRPRWF